jgi:hypothetical protein
MMTGPGPEKKFKPLFEQHGVLDVHCATIHKKKMFEAAVDTCHFIVSKSNKLNNLHKLFVGSTVFGPLNQSILNKVLCFTDSHPCFKISDGGFVIVDGIKSLINVSQYLPEQPSDTSFQIMYKGNDEPVYVETKGTLCSVGKWKVIVPRSRAVNYKTMFVLAPEFGCDKLHGFIEFDSKEEAELALSFFNTKLVQYCANTYKMSHGKYASGYKQLFNQTNCLRNPGFKQWTDESAFDFFQINQEEQTEILKQFEKKSRTKIK